MRNWQSVLVLGCGISTEPEAIARAGYEVLATDVSSFAIDYMRTHPASGDELAYWHQMRGEPEPTGRIGTCRYEVRDLAQAEPNAAFDVVYAPWVWQCLTPATQRSGLERLSDWIRPGGACLVTLQNIGGDSIDALNRDFANAGFFDGYEMSSRWNAERRSQEKYMELYARDEANVLRRLAEGEKLALIYVAGG